MCTILLAWRCVEGADYVLAANRDELVARAAEPPQLLSSSPPIAGGRDLMAGGTWLAVAPGARVCAVTNRRIGATTDVVRDPARRSRGAIPVEALMQDEDAIQRYFDGLGGGRFNPVNVLYVSPTRAVAASIDDSGPARITELEPGVHVLSVGEIDDGSRDKDVALYQHIMRTLNVEKSGVELELQLRVILSRHNSPTGDPLDAACIHGDEYGTVSSSTVISVDGFTTYRHAQGRPCATPFALVEALDRAA